MSNAGRDALVAMLSRLKADLSSLNLGRPDVARLALQAKYPLTGDYLVEVRRLCVRGLDDGWMCPAPEASGHPSPVAQPSRYFPFAVDALHLDGTGLGHAHPKGEVNLAWALAGTTPQYCGLEQGWAVFAPGSRHVPSVAGGRMLVLHFLPDGAIEWDEAKPPKRASQRSSGRTVSATRGGASRATQGSPRAKARASSTGR